MPDRPMPVFDGHNDLLLRLRAHDGDTVRAFLDGGAGGHLDVPRAAAGGFAGGLFAAFVPSHDPRAAAPEDALMRAPAYDVPLPPPLDPDTARDEALAMFALLRDAATASAGAVRVCATAADVRACRGAGTLAAVPHLEGADGIDAGLERLDEFERAGVRSIGPVWSRPNVFGHGVPFRFPSPPDAGPGLTDAGRALVRECNRRRILVDVSHLTERGFWDVARVSDAPLVATHSNAHALTPHARNLTDAQLEAIRGTGGIVGVNFAVSFLREDGRIDADTPLERVVRHVEHLLAHAGEDGVGFGSDFDGATVPDAIGDVAGLPRLVDALRAAFGDALTERIAYGNWLRVLERTWGA